MRDEKSFAEKTSADDTSIGFEYQYYYFLHRLLNLKAGQSVGLEVADDVHIQGDADFLLLFQLKHTVKKAASGDPIALPELDGDLWKTVHNWSKVISDETQNRASLSAQLEFVRKTEFHLVTNKSQSKTNSFLSLLEKFKSGQAEFVELRAATVALHEKTADENIKGYIASLIALDDAVVESFFNRLFVRLSLDDVIGQVKASIRDKFIDPARIDSVYARLDSNIRKDNFIAIKAGEPVLISYDQLMGRYRHIFTDGRSKTLPMPKFQPVLPQEIFSQLFIKRLAEISALDPQDTESAIDLTLEKLRIAHYLESWVQSGDLISDEVDALHYEVQKRWKNRFQFAFRKCKSSRDVVDCALDLLIALRAERFSLGPSELNTSLSNGELYYLSDGGRIGWHRDWETM